jgi:hypothetical protein
VSPPLSLLSKNSMKSMKLTSRMVTSVSTTAVHRPRGPTRSSKCEGCRNGKSEGDRRRESSCGVSSRTGWFGQESI